MGVRGLRLFDATKRVFDVVVAATLLVALLPVLLAIAAVVRLGVGTPVIFRQRRAGRGAAPFTVSKFTTMTSERGEDGELLPDADRLTRVGRLLRRASLDELPQLVDVLAGRMSLIGPRPLPIAYVDRYSDRQRRRLEVRPGLTGWAQVNGRNAVDWPERLEMDVWYVEHRSWAVDARIAIRSVAAVLSGDGVSADGHATMHEFLGDRSPSSDRVGSDRSDQPRPE